MARSDIPRISLRGDTGTVIYEHAVTASASTETHVCLVLRSTPHGNGVLISTGRVTVQTEVVTGRTQMSFSSII